MSGNTLVKVTTSDGHTRTVTPLELDGLVNIHDRAPSRDWAMEIGQRISNFWLWLAIGLLTIWGLALSA